jgi:hypothetical protein
MNISQNQSFLFDQRSQCLSVTLTTSVDAYISIIKPSYENNGGLEQQRSPLKTKTAITIRKRMVDDLIKGAILPPLVIGVIVNSDTELQGVQTLATAGNLQGVYDIVAGKDQSQIAIIDGMQRTTALIEAERLDSVAMSGRDVRVEFWIAKSINSLIYRMLILNTGQVPWDMKRQLDTVYSFLLREISQQGIDVQVFEVNNGGRRTSAGEFQSSVIIEAYLAFTSRKANVDVKERVSEDFARLDATESASESENLSRFIEVVRQLVSLDKVFSEFKGDASSSEARFNGGRDIFSVRAAVLGFVSAAAVNIYGDPGFKLENSEIETQANLEKASVDALIAKISVIDPVDLGKFLELDTLNQVLFGRTGGVGDFERDFFHKAFTSLIKHGANLPDMLPCWRAR